MISMPGVPLLTLDVFLTLFYVALFFFRGKLEYQDNNPFPFKIPFICLFISWTLSAVFSIVGFGSALSQYLRDVCDELFLIYIMWKLITNEKDFKFLIRGFMAAIFVSCLYGMFEGAIESNPLAEYEMSFNSDDEKVLVYDYSGEMRRGYRVKSIFEHAIGGGVMWGISIVMLLFSWSRNGIKCINRPIGFVLISLCFVCVLLTKSRGPILFLLIAGAGFFQIKSKYFYYSVFLGVMVLYCGWSFFEQFADNFLSIFSSKAQENVGGSSSEMRIDQLAAAFLLMQSSPLWGLGFKYQNVLDNTLTETLGGSESMWFDILPSFGLLGILANLVLAYYSIVKLPRKFHSKILFFYATAYWVVGSLTSLPGIKMYYYYFVIILIMKFSGIKLSRKIQYNSTKVEKHDLIIHF